jgi:hypothetical protein
MARTAGKKQAPAKIEEDDDAEGWEDAVVETDEKEAEANLRLRDWRDVERFREMKELRSLVDDDYGLEEIFHIPLKPRAEPGIPVPRTVARLLPKGQLTKTPVAMVTKPAPAKPPAKPAKAAAHAKAAVKAVKAKAKPPARPAPAKKPAARLKAKAKRK